MKRTACCLPVRTEMDATRVVLEAGKICRDTSFSEADRQRLATAVSELARNILKYAGHGQILISTLEAPPLDPPEGAQASRPGIEVTASDDGPGIADVELALQDHTSSGGTLGLGLPGVRRLMDEFEIDSTPGRGTRVTVRKWQ
ncbi:MAG: ATP-binding protein [Thermoanaerobaculia bacterium]